MRNQAALPSSFVLPTQGTPEHAYYVPLYSPGFNASSTGIAHHPGVQAIPHTAVSTNTMKAGGGGTFSFPSPTGNSNKEVLGSVYMTHPTPVTSGQKTRESEAEHKNCSYRCSSNRASSNQVGHVRWGFQEFINRVVVDCYADTQHFGTFLDPQYKSMRSIHLPLLLTTRTKGNIVSWWRVTERPTFESQLQVSRPRTRRRVHNG